RAARGEADPLIALALEAGVPATTAEKVLHLIQRFDPVGCGSRDLRECLLVQARWFLTEGEGKDDPDADLLPAIIAKHLKAVETKKYQNIVKDLHVPLDEVVAAVKLLARLDPKPGRRYADDEPQYITPDVYIHKIGTEYVTVLNDDGLSKLRISQHYRQALKNAAGNLRAEVLLQLVDLAHEWRRHRLRGGEEPDQADRRRRARGQALQRPEDRGDPALAERGHRAQDRRQVSRSAGNPSLEQAQ